MRIDFFEIENKPEAQAMVMPWPLHFCAFNIRGGMVRIYYRQMPGATEQTGTFYCVKSEQNLPETFPAKMVGSVFPVSAQTSEPDEPDTAVHIFFEVPVKKPRKPRPVKSTTQLLSDEKNGGGKNGDS